MLLYHILHWPDHDIPNDEAPILELLERLYKDRNPSEESPILIHCRFNKKNDFIIYHNCFSLSAGCGRTGSIIAIDLCRTLLNDEVRKKMTCFLFI